ncbi:MAG: archaellin/type IV pilin N-terminal domain-containing protein [Thermoproteota archaeon]
MRILKDRRGISPVITTVIIVAVGITIAIAVALWMSGLIGRFTTYEEIKITTAYPEYDSQQDEFNLYLTFKNTGSSPTTIEDIRVNGLSISSGSWSGTFTVDWQVRGGTTGTDLPVDAKVGDTVDLTLTFDNGMTYPGGTLTHSVSLDVKLVSASGKEYPTSAVLP